LSCGWGGVLTLASYKTFHGNILRDVYFICGVTAGTAIFSGFVIFSVVGFMAHTLGVEVSEVAAQVQRREDSLSHFIVLLRQVITILKDVCSRKKFSNFTGPLANGFLFVISYCPTKFFSSRKSVTFVQGI
jgi:hypothetical protein